LSVDFFFSINLQKRFMLSHVEEKLRGLMSLILFDLEPTVPISSGFHDGDLYG